jgi:hypothetical protein
MEEIWFMGPHIKLFALAYTWPRAKLQGISSNVIGRISGNRRIYAV